MLQIERMRTDILAGYRATHGERIRKDIEGRNSAVRALEQRVSWACGEWVEGLADTMEGALFADMHSL